MHLKKSGSQIQGLVSHFSHTDRKARQLLLIVLKVAARNWRAAHAPHHPDQTCLRRFIVGHSSKSRERPIRYIQDGFTKIAGQPSFSR